MSKKGGVMAKTQEPLLECRLCFCIWDVTAGEWVNGEKFREEHAEDPRIINGEVIREKEVGAGPKKAVVPIYCKDCAKTFAQGARLSSS